jgi:hypothetical protein
MLGMYLRICRLGFPVLLIDSEAAPGHAGKSIPTHTSFTEVVSRTLWGYRCFVSRASIVDRPEFQHETLTLSSGCLRGLQCADDGTKVEVMPTTSSGFINSCRIGVCVCVCVCVCV